jgi:hypothetical protein
VNIVGAIIHSLWIAVYIIEYRRQNYKGHARRESLEPLIEPYESPPPYQPYDAIRISRRGRSIARDEMNEPWRGKEDEMEGVRRNSDKEHAGPMSDEETGKASREEENIEKGGKWEKLKAAWEKFLFAASLQVVAGWHFLG